MQKNMSPRGITFFKVLISTPKNLAGTLEGSCWKEVGFAVAEQVNWGSLAFRISLGENVCCETLNLDAGKVGGLRLRELTGARDNFREVLRQWLGVENKGFGAFSRASMEIFKIKSSQRLNRKQEWEWDTDNFARTYPLPAPNSKCDGSDVWPA